MERRISLRATRPRKRQYSPGVPTTSSEAEVPMAEESRLSAEAASSSLPNASEPRPSFPRNRQQRVDSDREKKRIPGAEIGERTKFGSAVQAEANDTDIIYPAEVLTSMTNRHPLLLYRFRSNPEFCYKFYYRNTRSGYHSYMCLACHTIRHNYKRQKDKSAHDVSTQELPVLAASMNYSHFLADPESLGHFCYDYGGIWRYTKVMAQQEYREVGRLVELQNISGAEADEQLIERICQKFPAEAESMLAELGTSKQRRATFCRRLKKNPGCKAKARYRIVHAADKESENTFVICIATKFFRFPAEVGLSKSKSHPLLIYHLRSIPKYCFKFHFKRQNQFELIYLCLGCRMTKLANPTVSVPYVGVSTDGAQFLSDPEKLDHCCRESNFLYEYSAVHLEQLYRGIRSHRTAGRLTYQETISELTRMMREKFPLMTESEVMRLIPEKSFAARPTKQKASDGRIAVHLQPERFEYFEDEEIRVQCEEEVVVEELCDHEGVPKRRNILRSRDSSPLPPTTVMKSERTTGDDDFVDVVTVDGRSSGQATRSSPHPYKLGNSWEVQQQDEHGAYLEREQYSIVPLSSDNPQFLHCTDATSPPNDVNSSAIDLRTHVFRMSDN